jgi:hypothetical protein
MSTKITVLLVLIAFSVGMWAIATQEIGVQYYSNVATWYKANEGRLEIRALLDDGKITNYEYSWLSSSITAHRIALIKQQIQEKK